MAKRLYAMDTTLHEWVLYAESITHAKRRLAKIGFPFVFGVSDQTQNKALKAMFPPTEKIYRRSLQDDTAEWAEFIWERN